MAINLEKGQRINLQKSNGSKLQNVCVGINWGAIEKKGFLGLSTSKEAVDLDASCALFNANKQLEEVVYFGHLKSTNGAVKHSGDDLTGDLNGNDGLDNEVITLNLSQLDESTTYAAFVLNSFRGHDFSKIPFASIRIYEGTSKMVNEVFAKYDIAHGAGFAGHVSMVMGVFYKRNGEWKFNAVGEPTKDRDLQHTVKTVAEQYL
ncbi:TerD family protein [Mucilaginibacter robiniae]|uniref:TerD family protein n=1 Tax=Mucilaginibacter robiniae TaxID=2728022 RepID=A0A7L5E6J3_9SPHI|nr:TerD family protein [Mucilaginibacter robiniae]QJD96453.1 TerD family protein [Mucilaginibacter robiniae]